MMVNSENLNILKFTFFIDFQNMCNPFEELNQKSLNGQSPATRKTQTWESCRIFVTPEFLKWIELLKSCPFFTIILKWEFPPFLKRQKLSFEDI